MGAPPESVSRAWRGECATCLRSGRGAGGFGTLLGVLWAQAHFQGLLPWRRVCPEGGFHSLGKRGSGLVKRPRGRFWGMEEGALVVLGLWKRAVVPRELPHWSGLGIFPPRSVKDDSKEPGMSSERRSE